MSRVAWLALAAAACALAGCGQQGPLYLPERSTEAPPAAGAPAAGASAEDADDGGDEEDEAAAQ